MVHENLHLNTRREGGRSSSGRQRRLRVLFITEFLPWPLNTGGRIRTYHILRQVALRHEVTLATQKLPGDIEAEERIRPLISRLCTVPLRSQSFIRKTLAATFSLTSPKPYVSMYSHYRHALSRLIRTLIKRESFDVIHIDHLDAAVYLQDCLPKIAVYLDEHNYETNLLEATSNKTSKLLLRWYLSSQLWKLARFESRILRTVRAVGVVSANDAKMIAAVAPETALEVIPNGVDLAFFDIPRQPVPYRVVTVGSLDWLPNIEGIMWFLDNVWPAVHAAKPEATLHIVGRNPSRVLLQRSCQHVTVAGSVPDVRDYVTGAAAFVVPLFAGGGTRLKVLEAMAMRVPIVSTSTGIEGIDCIYGKHVLVAEDAKDFASKLLELLDNPDLGAQLATAGRSLVEQHYGWDAIGERLDDFYRRTVHIPAQRSVPQKNVLVKI
jgi:sugar transferase (PEP-CTERM/EpsH1 system associated)